MSGYDEPVATRRRPGAWKGRVWIGEDLEAPLPDDLLDDFLGESGSPEVDAGSSADDERQPRKPAGGRSRDDRPPPS